MQIALFLCEVGLKGQSENEEAIEKLRSAQKAGFKIYAVAMHWLVCM